jgi:hypothetical protein
MTPMEKMIVIAIVNFVMAAVAAGTCGGLLAYIKYLKKQIKK